MAVWPWRKLERRERLQALLPMLAGIALLLVFSRLQAGETEPQDFFSTVDAELEKLQRLRGAYIWVSMWDGRAIRQHLLLGGVCLVAWLRLRRVAGPWLGWVMLGIPACALLTMPLSYALLEGLKWSLVPQFQPARAVMFVSALAVIGSGAAGVTAARSRRIWEAAPWFVVAFTIPAQADVLRLLIPRFDDPAVGPRLAVVVSLAVAATLAARWETARPRWSAVACAAAMLGPFWAMPGPAQVRNYPNLDEPELHELGEWARAHTAKDAVFLFPEHGRALQPGFFRVYGLRSLYVDWKSGGQVNILKRFAMAWWDRWRKVTPEKFDPAEVSRYAELGIDYVVVKPATVLDARAPVYRNARYVVYALRPRL
jgi:hypothetical protein